MYPIESGVSDEAIILFLNIKTIWSFSIDSREAICDTNSLNG